MAEAPSGSLRMVKQGRISMAEGDGEACLTMNPLAAKRDLLSKAVEGALKAKGIRDEQGALLAAKVPMLAVAPKRPLLRVTLPRDLVLADTMLRS